MDEPLRILVVGMSCSGKTTLGKELSLDLCIPVLDLDDIGWMPNWVQRPGEEFRNDLRTFIDDNKSWIISGNYTGMSKGIAWESATHIIWLNYPLRVLIYRYFKRTVKRMLTQEKVCGNNVETLYNTLFSEESLLLWILKQYKPLNQQYYFWKQEKYSNKVWLEMNRQEQTDRVKELIKN